MAASYIPGYAGLSPGPKLNLAASTPGPPAPKASTPATYSGVWNQPSSSLVASRGSARTERSSSKGSVGPQQIVGVSETDGLHRVCLAQDMAGHPVVVEERGSTPQFRRPHIPLSHQGVCEVPPES